MRIHHSITELIGNTPIVKSRHLDTGLCQLFFKLEAFNPGGSIKDRIGLTMIEAAEQRGDLKPGGIIVEGTAGKTGIGLALVAQQKGYRLILVVPDKMSREKIFNLKAMGAEVVLTRSDVAEDTRSLLSGSSRTDRPRYPGCLFHQSVRQRRQPAPTKRYRTRKSGRRWTVKMDAIVFGVGSSGTVTGLSRFFRREAPQVELILADPVRVRFWPSTSMKARSAPSRAVGWWKALVRISCPPISDFSHVKKAYAVSDRESFLAGRELLAREGILGGSSTGTILAAALRYCREQTEPKNVVMFVCDTGNKYLSKMYNDYWMLDNGFLERPHHGDLRDLILRPYSQRDTVVIAPTDALTVAYQRMKLYDVSQLPVMQDDQIVGIVDESDVLMHVYGDESRFRDTVATAMIDVLDKIDVRAPVESLLPVFQRGHVAIVMDGAQFLGLITRIDLLNYLRRRVQ
ncbi:MAG: pyridoxal-phosphate dependent enzyme [Lysobacteraceae bacterium]